MSVLCMGLLHSALVGMSIGLNWDYCILEVVMG